MSGLSVSLSFMFKVLKDVVSNQGYNYIACSHFDKC